MLRDNLRIESEPPRSEVVVSEEVSKKPSFPPWMLAALSLTIMLALSFGLFIGRRAVEPLKQSLAELKKEREALSAQLDRQPTCDDGKQVLAQVRDFLGQGRLNLAAGLAETKLAQQNSPLCSKASAALAGLWYEVSIDRLFATPRPQWAGEGIGQEVASRWATVERKAEDYHVPEEKRWAPISIATRAYNAQLWLLADAAFRRAWADGAVGDRAITFRYDLLRNLGYHRAQSGGADERKQAVRSLATAQAIADVYNLPKTEACQDLQALGYTDCREPEPDPLEPVLAGKNTDQGANYVPPQLGR